jgi:hypothetical protein
VQTARADSTFSPNDWLVYQRNAARSGFNELEALPGANLAYDPNWKNNHIPAGIPAAAISTQPVVATVTINNVPTTVIYWGSWDGHEYATNAATGGLIWKSPFLGQVPNCYNNTTLKYGVVSAAAVADVTLPGQQQATPVVFVGGNNGTPYSMVGAVNKDGIFYAFDRSNLSQGPLWTVQIANGDTVDDSSISSAAWDGNLLYVGGGATTIDNTSCVGSLRALIPPTVLPGTINFQWQVCFDNPTNGDGPVIGAVVADAGNPQLNIDGIAAVGEGSNIAVVDTSTGLPSYYQDLNYPKYTNPHPQFVGAASISHGALYIADAIQPQNGLQLDGAGFLYAYCASSCP